MLKVGLTGGLASGKSFVGAAFEHLGCKLIEADKLGHEVLLPAGSAYASVVENFGPGILDPDGAIDRKKLALEVFADSGYRRFDRLILVWCEERLQIDRAMERGATRAEVLARLASQMPLAEKRKYADYVIDTSGAKEETLRQTQEVYNSLRSLKL